MGFSESSGLAQKTQAHQGHLVLAVTEFCDHLLTLGTNEPQLYSNIGKIGLYHLRDRRKRRIGKVKHLDGKSIHQAGLREQLPGSRCVPPEWSLIQRTYHTGRRKLCVTT